MSTLTIAIPSKGRLQEQTLDYLADAGLRLVQSGGARDYAARLSGLDNVSVSLLSAAEIADELIAGRVHLGVTGEDLLAEHGSEDRAFVVERLGFGKANVIVAVPRSWIDVSHMADLDDVAADFHSRHHRKLRVATKFMHLSRAFFASHGIADYRIIESLGATEGAPAAGTAEVVVDITTTGATLEANGLKILDDGIILESQAALVASLRANWHPQAKGAAQELFDRIAARVLAKSSQTLDLPASRIDASLLKRLTANYAARTLSAEKSDRISLLVPDAQFAAVVALIREQAPGVTFTVQKPDQVFAGANLLFERFEAAFSSRSVR